MGTHIRIVSAVVVFSLVGLLLLPRAAAAQVYESSVGWTVGALASTSLNDGVTGDVLDLKPDPTWNAGLQYDRWLGAGRVGIGLRGTISRQGLEWTQGQRDIYLYLVDLSLLLRLLPADEDRTASPFFSVGGGIVRRGLGTGDPLSFAPAGVRYSGDEETHFGAVGGFGIDFFPDLRWGSSPVAIRVEARDHVEFSSPFDPLNTEGDDFGMIHNLQISLSFHTGLGR